MKEKVIIVEELLEKAEEYAKTSIQLYKLKAIDKTTDVFSSIAAGLVIAVIITFFIILLSIGFALYLGDILGKTYYGFLAVASMYAVIGIFSIVFRKSWLEDFFNSYIINQIFKDK